MPFIGGILSALFGSEVGRLVMVGLAAFLFATFTVRKAERARCEALAAQSRAAADQIDANAAKVAIATAQRQKADAEARAALRERDLKELSDVVESTCTLSPADADRLNRLQQHLPGGQPAAPAR
jgi:uncharacterized membrane protein